MSDNGVQILKENFRELRRNLWQTLFRPKLFLDSDRQRSKAIFQNFFLHIQSTRMHKYSLRPTYTFGLGLITFFLFLILCVTGVLLMVYYTPSIESAYTSVKDLSITVTTGRYLRNMHRWAAHGMVFFLFLHMIRVFYTSSYKRGRGKNWLIGMGLFVVTLLLSFSGYLLPWDQLAYWAITIGANIAGSATELTDALGVTHIVDVGKITKHMLIGGNVIGQEALIRFYLLHVMLLPIACILLIGLHFWRIRKDGGLSRPDNADEIIYAEEGVDMVQVAAQKGNFNLNKNKTYGLMELVKDKSPQQNQGPENNIFTWPTGVWAELALFMLTFAGLMLLSVFFDAPLKEVANPAIPENPAKAPWYFLGLQEMVSYSAFMGGMGIPMVALIGLALIPYLDREDTDFGIWFSNATGRKIAIRSAAFSTTFLLILLWITVQFGWLRNWFPEIPQLVVILLNPGTVIVVVFIWWCMRILKKTGSTRMSAISLFTCFIIGFTILTIMALYFRGPNWAFYWSASQWPIH